MVQAILQGHESPLLDDKKEIKLRRHLKKPPPLEL
jgi:hypothetical protein